MPKFPLFFAAFAFFVRQLTDETGFSAFWLGGVYRRPERPHGPPLQPSHDFEAHPAVMVRAFPLIDFELVRAGDALA